MEQAIFNRLLDLPLPPWVGNALWLVLLGLAGVDAIKEIPFQPIRSSLRWVGKIMNAAIMAEIQSVREDLGEKIKRVSSDLEAHIEDQDEMSIEELRASILAFSSSLARSEKHSQKEFENVMRSHDRYIGLCQKKKIQNGYAETEFGFIQDEYKKQYCDGGER